MKIKVRMDLALKEKQQKMTGPRMMDRKMKTRWTRSMTTRRTMTMETTMATTMTSMERNPRRKKILVLNPKVVEAAAVLAGAVLRMIQKKMKKVLRERAKTKKKNKKWRPSQRWLPRRSQNKKPNRRKTCSRKSRPSQPQLQLSNQKQSNQKRKPQPKTKEKGKYRHTPSQLSASRPFLRASCS